MWERYERNESGVWVFEWDFVNPIRPLLEECEREHSRRTRRDRKPKFRLILGATVPLTFTSVEREGYVYRN